MHYDAVVVGLGAMGSAALYQLAKAGASVLGIDRYAPPHTFGSTHGDTRISRLAVGEGEEYVPLVRRSHEIWREIENQTDTTLFEQCGGLIMATQDNPGMHGNSEFLAYTIATAKRFAIEHDTRTTDEIGQRWPQFSLVGSETGYWEPAAGFLRPERCVEAQLQLASSLGATVSACEQLLSYDDDGRRVTINTTSGTVTAKTIIIAAGPWVTELVPELTNYTRVYRQVLYWFDLENKTEFDSYRKQPVYIWGYGADRDEMIYGFPMVDGPDGGAKVAREDYSTETSVDEVRRDVTQSEIDSMYEQHVRDRLPGLSGRCVKARVCLYTVTPDSRFIIDRHPVHRNVIVASPCSGHGFKHSAAIGESLAQLATTGRTDVDLSPFRLPAHIAVPE